MWFMVYLCHTLKTQLLDSKIEVCSFCSRGFSETNNLCWIMNIRLLIYRVEKCGIVRSRRTRQKTARNAGIFRDCLLFVFAPHKFSHLPDKYIYVFLFSLRIQSLF